MSGWRIHNNVARDTKASPTMEHGFDLSELANAADAVTGHDNFVRGSKAAGYVRRSNHTHFSPDDNVGTFATA